MEIENLSEASESLSESQNETKVLKTKQSMRDAVKRYREKNPEKFNELQRRYYHRHKNDEEWKKNFNERCRLNNQKRRERIAAENGIEKKPRGRPRKEIKLSIQELI